MIHTVIELTVEQSASGRECRSTCLERLIDDREVKEARDSQLNFDLYMHVTKWAGSSVVKIYILHIKPAVFASCLR